jgi:hypothetical protein
MSPDPTHRGRFGPSSWYTGYGPWPGPGPATAWQKMVSTGLFCAIYGLIAGYAAIEDDWTAFAWVTGLAVLALGSSLAGMRVWRRQRAREAVAESQRQSKAQHRHASPHDSRKRRH